MNTTHRKAHPLLIPVFLAVLFLNACADGGAITTGGPGGCGTTLTSATGLWLGSGNFVGGGQTVGMIAGGDLVILQLTPDSSLTAPVIFRFYFGSYNTTTLSGIAEVYDGSGRLLAADQPLNITVAGTLNVTIGPPRALMPLCPLIDGTANLVYNRPSVTQGGVNLIVGNWLFEVPSAQPPYTLNYIFDGTNFLTGNDTPGCLYNGIWVDPNPLRNLTRINALSLTNQQPGGCNGEDGGGNVIQFEGDGYGGFAFFLDADPSSANILLTAVANGETAYFNLFTRVGASPLVPPSTPSTPDDDFDPNFIPGR